MLKKGRRLENERLTMEKINKCVIENVLSP